jgi:hypothetical protein
MGFEKAQASLSEADTWCGPLLLSPGGFDFFVWGDFVGTVTLQASPNEGQDWVPVKTYTEASVDLGQVSREGLYRAGFASGDYTSGTANIQFRQ